MHGQAHAIVWLKNFLFPEVMLVWTQGNLASVLFIIMCPVREQLVTQPRGIWPITSSALILFKFISIVYGCLFYVAILYVLYVQYSQAMHSCGRSGVKLMLMAYSDALGKESLNICWCLVMDIISNNMQTLVPKKLKDNPPRCLPF